MTPGHHVDDPSLAKRPPVDASMTLLNEVMHRPLDAGYAEAARRKARGEAPPRRNRTVLVLLVLAVVLGFATASAARQLRAPQPGVVAARELLVEEITSRRAQLAERTQTNADLQASIDGLRDAALSSTDPEAVEQLTQDGLSNGTIAARGPGIVVTVENGPNTSEEPAALVQDSDLQMLVNALWASGAEAIAVNDQRLTSTTAIRSAGSAILVDLVGVSAPYEVVAIGGKNDLETGLARSSAARQLSTLGSQYGIKTSVSSSDELTVPAGPTRVLFYAGPVSKDNDEG